MIAAVALAAHLAAIDCYEVARDRGSVSEAFAAARPVNAALLPVIEDLTEEEYSAIEHRLAGMIVNREEVLLAEPDAKFFLDLARKRGNTVDVEFFENYLATFPDGVWPSYVEQETDVTGCTAFGKGELVERYAGWLAFRAAHPHAYEKAVAERLADIEMQVDARACGDDDSVLRELREFAAKFPRSPAAPRVRARIKALARTPAGPPNSLGA